jgi:4-hydroxybenzoate polyprenyltransferase
MQRIKSLLIFRPLNLFLIAIFQIITFYFLDFDALPEDLLRPQLWWMILSLSLITAAGYSINDYFDLESDKINKPNKVYITAWNPKVFLWVYVMLNAIGLWIGSSLSPLIFLILCLISLSLFLYSWIFQRYAVVGNLIIATCTAFSIMEVYLLFETQQLMLVLFFTVIAYLLTWIRETIKDVEDVDGDAEMGFKTLPIVAGKRFATSFSQSLMIFTLVLFSYFQYQWIWDFFSGRLHTVYFGYQLVCVLIPMAYVYVKLWTAKSPKDFHHLSAVVKYIMCTGVAAMLFF